MVFCIFVVSVGFIAGLKFFSNMKKNFTSYVLPGLVIIIVGALVAVACVFLGKYMGETDMERLSAIISGLFAGALTFTPAFSAAKASVSTPEMEQLVSVGYGIAYIFGVIGVILFVQLIPKILKISKERRIISKRSVIIMFDVSKVDNNFDIKTQIDKKDIKFYKIDEAPFKIYGVFRENGKYRRMPESVAKNVSEGVYTLHSNTAGGRVRFATDSTYIAIHAKMDGIGKMSHFALTGSTGFDLYVDNYYAKTFVPPVDIKDEYESIFVFETKERREITINFPLYSNVNELHIGLQKTSLLAQAKPYNNTKPIIYYGSSITQGGCASRPGMSYQAIISRNFNCDYINLGFSGSAKAEDQMIEYIKNLDMSVFVYDYDHNAPTVEYLEKTHEKMFKAIREKNSLLPVIIMSRPKRFLTEEEKTRRSIIETTYLNAVSAGDKNVYFIDGEALTELCQDSGTVDNCHPTDFGFASMAKALAEVIVNIDIR